MADKKWWNSPEVKARRLDKDELPLWHDLQDQTSPNNLPEWVRDGKVKVFCGWGFNVNIWPQPDVYNDALEIRLCIRNGLLPPQRQPPKHGYHSSCCDEL